MGPRSRPRWLDEHGAGSPAGPPVHRGAAGRHLRTWRERLRRKEREPRVRPTCLATPTPPGALLSGKTPSLPAAASASASRHLLLSRETSLLDPKRYPLGSRPAEMQQVVSRRPSTAPRPSPHHIAMPPRRPEPEGRRRAGGGRPQGGRGPRRHKHRDRGSTAAPSLRTIPPACQESIPMTEIAPVAAVHVVGGASAAWSSSAPVTRRRRLAGRGSVRSVSANEETGR